MLRHEGDSDGFEFCSFIFVIIVVGVVMLGGGGVMSRRAGWMDVCVATILIFQGVRRSICRISEQTRKSRHEFSVFRDWLFLRRHVDDVGWMA